MAKPRKGSKPPAEAETISGVRPSPSRVNVCAFREEVTGEFKLAEQDRSVHSRPAVLILCIGVEARGEQRLHGSGDGCVARTPVVK